MTWRLYALTSTGVVLGTAVAAFVVTLERSRQNPPAVVSQPADRSGAIVDLGAQADRLKARLADVTDYHQPSRDAFRFAPPPRPAIAPPVPSLSQAPPAVIAPTRPPYGLAGMSTSVEDGVTKRTAILSSLQGVLLVKEGDVLDTGYRVTSVSDDAVTLESTSDGKQTTLRLSNSDSR